MAPKIINSNGFLVAKSSPHPHDALLFNDCARSEEDQRVLGVDPGKRCRDDRIAGEVFTGGFTGFILGLAYLPYATGMLGASAAIFALAGCVMLVRPLKFSWLFLTSQGLIAVIYFAYNVVIVYEKSRRPGYDPQVAYVAHSTGFLVGPFGIALCNHWKRVWMMRSGSC